MGDCYILYCNAESERETWNPTDNNKGNIYWELSRGRALL